MKATIESTDRLVQVADPLGNHAMARVWEGVTSAGVPFVAYITQVQVRSEADNSQFVRDLQENKKPSPATLRAIDHRLVM